MFRNLRENLMLVTIKQARIPAHCFHLAQQLKFSKGFLNLGRCLNGSILKINERGAFLS